MEQGDLYFKAIKFICDSWRTVLKYEVYHYTDKTKLLATVTNRTQKRKCIDYAVVIPGSENVTYMFQSMGDVVEFLVEHYE